MISKGITFRASVNVFVLKTHDLLGAIHNREIPVLAVTDTLPVPRYNHKGLIELLLDLLRSLLLVGLLRLLLVPFFSNDPF